MITAYIGDNGTLDTVVHFEQDGIIVDTRVYDSETRFDFDEDEQFLLEVLEDYEFLDDIMEEVA